VADLAPAELSEVLDLAAAVKADPRRLAGAASGRAAALVFEKPSLRTKASFSVGCARLGMASTYFGAEEVGLGTREGIADAARMLARYFDVVVHRTFGHERVVELAAAADVPVVNGLSAFEHPCQALADALTLMERFGSVEGLRIAWIGDGNNVCHSLVAAATLLGASVAVATPAEHEPDEAVVREAVVRGGAVEVLRDPALAVEGAHAVSTDTWVSMGQEAEGAARREAFRGYTVDAELMARARPDAVFLHCLPAHRGEEVTDEVLDSPASLVLAQAENRLHVQQALLALLLGVD
jgi:ornithine carbamoyltransferase